MAITGITTQLRTTDMGASLRFHADKLGFSVDFNYQDSYAGVRIGDHVIHLKQIDAPDLSIRHVDEGGHLHLYISVDGVTAFAEQLRATGVPLVKEVHETPWSTREFVIHDDQGHTLYFDEPLKPGWLGFQAAGETTMSDEDAIRDVLARVDAPGGTRNSTGWKRASTNMPSSPGPTTSSTRRAAANAPKAIASSPTNADVLDYSEEAHDLRIWETVAVYTFQWRLTYRRDGEPVQERGSDQLVLQHGPEGWQVAFGISASSQLTIRYDRSRLAVSCRPRKPKRRAGTVSAIASRRWRRDSRSRRYCRRSAPT